MTEAQFIILIAQMVVEHGIPAVIKAIQAWQVESPTAEDFEQLKEIVKDPDAYFADQ